MRKTFIYLLLAAGCLCAPGSIHAAEESVPAVAEAIVGAVGTQTLAPEVMAAQSDMRIAIDTLWVLLCGFLVFFMNAGFGMLESGLCRAKNTVNILAKNFIVFAVATLSYWAIGWGMMFGDGNSFVGTQGLFFLSGADNSPALGEDYLAANPFSTQVYEGVYSAVNWTAIPLFAKFFFQLVFAATAATIVSGAVAERVKFGSFLVFSFVLVAFMYPVTGHWIWGGGWLGSGNFRDFAGSTTVHSVGGWAALAGAIVLGPRLGKFTKGGQVKPIPGHNMTSAALGVFILWLGWFGFNPGSTMAAMNGSAITHVLVNTNLAAAMGTLGALLTSWTLLKKPDFSMILNGCLAGLVAITAPCAFVTPANAAIIGFLGGILVVLSVLLLDRVRVDDPVGAISVHLTCGIWGTLALGLFYSEQVATDVAALATGLGRMAQTIEQLKGILAVGAFTFLSSMVLWYVIKVVMGVRVAEEEEVQGLDIGEHGNEAYPNFTPGLSQAPGHIS